MIIKIFFHAINMVIRNFAQGLRLALVPMLLSQIIAGLGMYVLTGSIVPNPDALLHSAQTDVGTYYLLIFGTAFLNLFMMAWIAVGWHRFILLEERQHSYLPVWHSGLIWGYIKKILLLLLIMVPVILVISLVLIPIVIAAMSPTNQNPLMALIPFAIMYILIIWIFTRLSLVLPAVSIGETMGIGDAWFSSKPLSFAFLVVGVLSAIIMNIPALMVTCIDLPDVVAAILNFLFGIVGVLVAASVLTTFYGVAVEKREI